jgi:hypothetical protein
MGTCGKSVKGSQKSLETNRKYAIFLFNYPEKGYNGHLFKI